MKISIVTATFNSGATLRDTIESVLSQSHPDVEYIIVDGGSTDNTLDIIKEYEPRFEGRLKWASERDKGIYDAMNKGIARARGDVVGFLNSDDFYSTNDVVEMIAKEMADSEVDAVYADIHYVNDEDKGKCVRYYSSEGFRPWKMKLGFMPAHPSFYCRLSIYEKFGSFDIDFRVAADFECLLRLIFVNKIRTKYLKKDFVTMRTGGASSSGLQSHKVIWRDHKRAYKKNGVNSNFFLEGCRYFIKVYEVAHAKLKSGSINRRLKMEELESRISLLESKLSHLK